MRLFKFLERRWLNAFFDAGSLRLGTIYGYHDLKIHGAARGDAQDGRMDVERGFDEKGETFDLRKNNPIVSEMFKIDPAKQSDAVATPITLANLSLITSRQIENAYTFCSATRFTEEVFLRWHREEEIDACYVITAPDHFLHSITQVIEDEIRLVVHQRIEYTDKTVPFDSPHVRAIGFNKERESYAWQDEYRMVWPPKDATRNLNPKNILAPSAIRFAAPFAYVVNGEVTYATWP